MMPATILNQSNAAAPAETLAQADRFEQWRQAVEDQFRYGGSVLSLVIAVAVLVGCILLASWLSERQRRKLEPETIHEDHEGLLNSILAKLDLLPSQRELWKRMTRELKPMSAGRLLLCENAFDQHVEGWLSNNAAQGGSEVEVVRRIRSKLFVPAAEQTASAGQPASRGRW